jgi:excisionase family DNA binding protein
MTTEQLWLTPRQSADRLQVSLSTLRTMLRDGRLRGRRLRGSRLVRILATEVDALLEPLHSEEHEAKITA